MSQFTDRTAELKPITGETINNISSFGEDDRGEIYIVDLDGEIFKIADKNSLPQPTPVPTPVPTPAPTPRPTAPPSANATLSKLNPGTAGVRNSLTVTGAQRGSIVRFYYSRTNGTTTFSSGVCRGKALSMRSPVSLGSAVADSTGKATINVSLSRSLGGRTLYVQSRVESSAACKITNRVVQSIKRSTGGSTGGGFFPLFR